MQKDKASHNACRSEEVDRAMEKAQYCKRYNDARKGEYASIPTCSLKHASTDDAKKLEEFEECFEDFAEWFPLWDINMACKNATRVHTNHTSRCNLMQWRFEESSCVFNVKRDDCCNLQQFYRKRQDAVKVSEAKRKAEFMAIEQIDCRFKVLKADKEKRNETMHECIAKRSDVAPHLTIDYLNISAEMDCAPLAKPCDTNWLSNEYKSKAWFSKVQLAKCDSCEARQAPAPAVTPAPTQAPVPTDTVSGASAVILLDFSNGFVPKIGPADLVDAAADKSMIVDDPTGLPRKVLVVDGRSIALLAKYFQFNNDDFAIQMDQRRNFNGGNSWTFEMRGNSVRYDFYNNYVCVNGFGCRHTDCCDWSEWNTHKFVRKGGEIIQYMNGKEMQRVGNNPDKQINPTIVKFRGKHFTGHIANFMVFH